MDFSPSMNGHSLLVEQVCSGTDFIDRWVLIRRWKARLSFLDDQMDLMEAGMGFIGFGDLSS